MLWCHSKAGRHWPSTGNENKQKKLLRPIKFPMVTLIYDVIVVYFTMAIFLRLFKFPAGGPYGPALPWPQRKTQLLNLDNQPVVSSNPTKTTRICFAQSTRVFQLKFPPRILNLIWFQNFNLNLNSTKLAGYNITRGLLMHTYFKKKMISSPLNILKKWRAENTSN